MDSKHSCTTKSRTLSCCWRPLKIPKPSIYNKLICYCPGFIYVAEKIPWQRTISERKGLFGLQSQNQSIKSQGSNWRQVGKSPSRTEDVYIQGCPVFSQLFLASRAPDWRIVLLIFRLGLSTSIKATETVPLKKIPLANLIWTIPHQNSPYVMLWQGDRIIRHSHFFPNSCEAHSLIFLPLLFSYLFVLLLHRLSDFL